MTRILTVLIFLLTFRAGGWSGIIVDYSYYTGDMCLEHFSNLPADVSGQVTAVILGPIFKGYRGNNEKSLIVYDYRDTGTRFQRGRLETRLGSMENIRELVSYFSDKKIQVYAAADLFQQKELYNREIWNPRCFLPIVHNGNLLVDLDNSTVRDNIKNTAQALRSLGFSRIVADLSGLPRDYRLSCITFIRRMIPDALILDISGENAGRDMISSAAYRGLAWPFYMVPGSNAAGAQNSVLPEAMDYIPESSLSLSAAATAAWLYVKNRTIVIPATILTGQASDFFAFFNGGAFRPLMLSGGIMALGDTKRIALFNLGGNPEYIHFDTTASGTGFYKSIIGNGILHMESQAGSAFLMPQSISLWKME